MEWSSVRGWVLALPLAAVTAGGVVPAHGQSGSAEMAALQQRIEFLERQVRHISQQAVGGAGGRGTAPSLPSGPAGISSNPSTARLSIRVDQLEKDLRSATGRMEQLNFRVQQVNERLDRLDADLEYRLGEGAAPPSSSERSETPNPAPATQSGVNDGGAEATNGGTQGTALGPRILGTMTPEEFERNRPAPPTQRQSSPPEDGSTPEGEQAAESDPLASLASSTPREHYATGFDLMQKGRNAEARSAFETFLNRYPDNALAPNARYWLGETYYGEGDFTKAATTFLDGYEENKTGPKAPETLLKLGLSLSELDKVPEACATFQELDRAFPNAADAIKEPAAAEKKRLGCG